MLPASAVRRGIVDAHEGLVLLHDLPDLNEDLGNDSAFEVLDHLDAARRNDFAFAYRYFVHRGETRPDQRHNEKNKHAPQDPVSEIARALQHCRAALTHEIHIVGTRLECSRNAPGERDQLACVAGLAFLRSTIPQDFSWRRH